MLEIWEMMIFLNILVILLQKSISNSCNTLFNREMKNAFVSSQKKNFGNERIAVKIFF